MQGGEEERGKKGEVSFLFALFFFRFDCRLFIV
jgi:hypothetical protein